jgi:LPXTG-site transpeptidase (sortase) family protein
MALMVAGVSMMIAALILMLVAMGVIFNSNGGNSSLETVAAFGEPIRTATPGPTPTPTGQFPPGSNAPVARLIIEKAEIDAPVVIKGVDAQGVMQSPDNAYDTAWYDFSAHPGFGGNAVFAGHVDYIRVGKAVFWNLKDLEEGDLIQVRLQDGTVYKYAVNFREQFDAATAPVDMIVGPTPNETVTLITCGGTFNPDTHQYDKRLVIRAERVAATGLPPAAGVPGT